MSVWVKTWFDILHMLGVAVSHHIDLYIKVFKIQNPSVIRTMVQCGTVLRYVTPCLHSCTVLAEALRAEAGCLRQLSLAHCSREGLGSSDRDRVPSEEFQDSPADQVFCRDKIFG